MTFFPFLPFCIVSIASASSSVVFVISLAIHLILEYFLLISLKPSSIKLMHASSLSVAALRWLPLSLANINEKTKIISASPFTVAIPAKDLLCDR